MVAALDDNPALQNHDQIRICARWRGGCAMTSVVRPLHQPRQRFLDELLALGIEGGGGLVQKQDRRILEEGAGEGDALTLTA